MFSKLVAWLVVLAAALIGLKFLDGLAQQAMWLFFLIISYPVVSAFLSSLLDGTRFTPENLIKLYAHSLRSVPVLGTLLRRLDG